MAKRVLVAMSGGVDSSVAAAIVSRRGDEAVGVTMKLLARAETGFGCCGSPADVDDAKRVCEQLKISHYTVDLAESFEDKVIRPFVADYLSGRTPNPCVECNRSLKFGKLLRIAQAWGCESVATGHYARARDGRLYKSHDANKDQTYFLYSLMQNELAHVEFPIGDLRKDEVRKIARELNLKTADKPESMETCFVPARDVRGFVASRPESADAATLKPGTVRTTDGRTLGEHSGVAGFTIGQRKGLNLSAGEPLYVVSMDAETNTVVVGKDEDARSGKISVAAVTWTRIPSEIEIRAEVRIRHRHTPAPATLTLKRDAIVDVVFDEPQRAAAPGQAAVFYSGDEVLGGGTIASRR